MQSDDWSWIDEDDDWVPPTVDLTRPSIARVYDYGLGGKDNYPVDRELADKFRAIAPDVTEAARANRRFLVEVVTSMAQAGIQQFIDLGTGLPTSPSVHESAWAVQPGTKIVYVDNDPIVLAHNRALMRADERVAVLSHDLRQPASVLADPAVRGLLDFSRPIGLLMIAVMHFVEVASGPAIVGRYVRDLPSGSQLAISSLSSHGIASEVLRRTESLYGASTGTLLAYRNEAEIDALFDRLKMIQPLKEVYRSQTLAVLGGVGLKP
ncbi:MAG TPA: SAM-dependent methyltransferase [Kineosporiaceae bacterium]